MRDRALPGEGRVVSDLFSGQRYTRVASTPVFNQVHRRSIQGRVIFVGLTYSFGGTKKEKQTEFDYGSGG